MNRVLFSSKSDHWRTPSGVYDSLAAEFGFDFDPCPLHSTDGLTRGWRGRVFCNPPYSKVKDFVRKGLYHLDRRECEVLVYLLPARTGTDWFHEFCLPRAEEIRFLRGRLRFNGVNVNAPFDSMVVVFR